jgi:hypothetical protein
MMSKGRLMRFNIRDILWLTVVVALAVAWWSQTERLKKEATTWQHRATAAKGTLMHEGWEIGWDSEAVEFQNGSRVITCSPPKPGENYFWKTARTQKSSVAK